MSTREDRGRYLNEIIGRPYRLGASGPSEFDCYGLARHLQEVFYGRRMPLFQAPEGAGRIGLAGMIAAHPERAKWTRVPKAIDGAMVSMAKQDIGYHMGTFVDIDGGVIVHTLESPGVTIDEVFALSAMGWRNLKFYVPA